MKYKSVCIAVNDVKLARNFYEDYLDFKYFKITE